MLQALPLTCSENPVLTALAYGYLFPVYEDRDSFYQRFEQLFGENSGVQLLHLHHELETVTPNKPMPVLSKLIKDNVALRLANYRLANKNLSKIDAFFAMTQITVCKNKSLEVLNAQCDAHSEPYCIYLLHTEEGFQPFIDIRLLSKEQQVQLSAAIFKPIPATFLAFEGFLKKELTVFSEHLQTLERAPASLKGLATEATVLAPASALRTQQPLYNLTVRSEQVDQSVAAVTLDAVCINFDNGMNEVENPWIDAAPGAEIARLITSPVASGKIELLLEANLGFVIGGFLWVGVLPTWVTALIGIGVTFRQGCVTSCR